MQAKLHRRLGCWVSRCKGVAKQTQGSRTELKRTHQDILTEDDRAHREGKVIMGFTQGTAAWLWL